MKLLDTIDVKVVITNVKENSSETFVIEDARGYVLNTIFSAYQTAREGCHVSLQTMSGEVLIETETEEKGDWFEEDKKAISKLNSKTKSDDDNN
jgi:hypothetical protein